MERHRQTSQSTGRPPTLAPPVTETQLAPVPQPKKANVGSLIEFSSEAQQDPNEGVTFGDTPVHCDCPHCERSVITFIDHESSWVTWVLGFVVWFSLGWLAFWVLPLLWPAFKDVVHHCPRCLNVIERKSRIILPTFRSEVMTFKVGGCAIVLARKYVMIALIFVSMIIGCYVLRSTVHLSGHEMEMGPQSMLSWDDFLFDCGPRTSLGHRAATSRSFDMYRKRTFKWQGEVNHIREGFDVFFLHTKSVVMMRMYPARYPRRDLPDVALLFGEDLNPEVAELNPGDWVEFEATMTAHGHRGDPEVMALWHIRKKEKPSPLSSTPGGKHQQELKHKQSDQEPKPKSAASLQDKNPEFGQEQPKAHVQEVAKQSPATQSPPIQALPTQPPPKPQIAEEVAADVPVSPEGVATAMPPSNEAPVQ
eukprot:TRINITY_DN10372_c0_g1_i2.p1 TRINITY_DN10372_c0_g1~~TRINITY_DN10372_c0_g1_i2.p1  ORF type:complete len:421 (+),score=67.85 TRINITY_DN10372_c0_g1_i2:157-1419(+)